MLEIVKFRILGVQVFPQFELNGVVWLVVYLLGGNKNVQFYCPLVSAPGH